MSLVKAVLSLGLLVSHGPIAAAGPDGGQAPRATAAAVRPTPTPVATPASPSAARELVDFANRPTPTAAPLGSLVRRKASTDTDLVAGASQPAREDVFAYRTLIEESDGVLFVTGTVRNSGGEPSRPRVTVEGRRADGSGVAVPASLSPPGPIPPQGTADYSARLPQALRSTVRVHVRSAPTVGGEIGSAFGRRLAACLSFLASIPEGPGYWSVVVDVEIRNRCAESVPASRAAFSLAVRDMGGGVIERVMAGPDGPVPPGGVARVTVDVRAPRNGRAEASSVAAR